MIFTGSLFHLSSVFLMFKGLFNLLTLLLLFPYSSSLLDNAPVPQIHSFLLHWVQSCPLELSAYIFLCTVSPPQAFIDISRNNKIRQCHFLSLLFLNSGSVIKAGKTSLLPCFLRLTTGLEQAISQSLPTDLKTWAALILLAAKAILAPSIHLLQPHFLCQFYRESYFLHIHPHHAWDLGKTQVSAWLHLFQTVRAPIDCLLSCF